MPVESKNLPLPEEIEPHCPKCGQRCRKAGKKGLNYDIYACPDCGLQFEATIQILWSNGG